jgi:gliding motility-associated protein GldM
MALPKEPRQKMINMMYLVLTALLALNVSAEIINAFKVVDNSLKQSNTVLTSSTQAIYENFNEMLKDPKTAEKAGIWKPKADKARELAKQTSDLIDKYKLDLMKEAGYDPSSGDSSFKEDNIDAATRLFDTKGEGKNLYTALEKFKAEIMAIDPEIAKQLGSKIPLNLEVPKSTTGKKSTGDKYADWTYSNFHMTPTVAALTMLSKFQNDVKNTESQVATFCANQVGTVKIIYDKFVPLVSTNSSYFMPGEEMEIQAGLGAFNASVKPSVTIDGKALTVNEQGVAETKFNVGGTGSRTMNVTVKYVDPSTGEQKETSKKIEYTVGAPSGVAVSADKMNVLYIGVDNPLTITAGAGSEKVSASFSGGTISKASGSKYIARPNAGSSGEHTVTVNVEGKAAGKVMFRVKQLPNPAAYVGNLKAGAVPSASFKAMGGVIAKLEDSEFDAPFEVVSYEVGAISSEIPDYTPITNNGPRWTGNAANLINRLKPGALVAITNIRVKGPDGRVHTLNGSLSYSLK